MQGDSNTGTIFIVQKDGSVVELQQDNNALPVENPIIINIPDQNEVLEYPQRNLEEFGSPSSDLIDSQKIQVTNKVTFNFPNGKKKISKICFQYFDNSL